MVIPFASTKVSLSVTVPLVALVLSACCPPDCPPGPTNLAAQWDQQYEEQKYDTVIEQTSQVIEKGESADYYAEARLYRGLAQLRLGQALEAARTDLDIAEQSVDQLTSVDKTREQVLLYRGQMVVRARLGDIEAAQKYRDRAIEIAPEQKDDILKEFENAVHQ